MAGWVRRPDRPPPLTSATSTMHLTTTDVDHPGIPTPRIPSKAFLLVLVNRLTSETFVL